MKNCSVARVDDRSEERQRKSGKARGAGSNKVERAGGNRGTEPRGRTHTTMTDGKVSEIVDRGARQSLSTAGPTSGNQRTTTTTGGLGKRRSFKRREKILPPKRKPKRGKTRTVGDGCAVAISSTGRDETTSPSRWREPPSPPPPLARPPIFSSFSVADHLASRRRLLPPFRFRTALAAPFLSRSEGA